MELSGATTTGSSSKFALPVWALAGGPPQLGQVKLGRKAQGTSPHVCAERRVWSRQYCFRPMCHQQHESIPGCMWVARNAVENVAQLFGR